MDGYTILAEKDSTGASTTFTIGLGSDGSVVFTYGTYYPGSGNVESREADEWVSVPPTAFPRLAGALDVAGSEPGTLLHAVAEHVRASGVRSIHATKRMLDRLTVPYTGDTWIDYY